MAAKVKKKQKRNIALAKVTPLAVADGVPVFCSHKQIVNVEEIVRNPRNPNKHPPLQIKLLGKIIRKHGWRHSLIVSNQSGLLAAGEGRLDAAVAEGLKVVPVDYQDFESEAQEWAFVVADNQIPELAEIDKEKLAELLQSIKKSGADMETTGFDSAALAKLLASAKPPPPPTVIYSAEKVIDEAFKWYRKRGFPYRELPLHVCYQQMNALANTPEESLMNSDLGYHVADTYHPHRFHATAANKISPLDAFNDDKLLRKALRLTYENAGTIGRDYISLLSLVEGTQACANFRPGFAMKLYREFCEPGATVLDTSTGYGGRLLGFIASGRMGRYIGIDPSTKTHAGNKKMAHDLGRAQQVTLINQPAEDVDAKTLKGKCDFAFTSPPYFSKEHYTDESTQSYKRYTTIKEWLDGFLGPMLKLQFASLKFGGFSVVNIAEVQIGKEKHQLDKHCEDYASRAGFTLVERREYPLSGHKFGANLEEKLNVEPVLVFKKS